MNTRVLGWIFTIGSLLVCANGIRSAFLGPNVVRPDVFDSLSFFLWGISGVFGMVGFIRSNALGTNAAARALGFIPMIAFGIGALAEGLNLTGLINSQGQAYMTLTSIFWVTLMAGMLIVGIITIAARRWNGWYRFAPLLAVLMMPIAYGVGQLVGNILISGPVAQTGYLLLGLAIAGSEYQPLISQRATI